MDILTNPQTWASLFALTVLEVVLGIDNLVFLSIVSNRLPVAQQKLGRKLGLLLALLMRLILLATVSWVAHMTKPLVVLFNQVFSWRDILLILGGVFLLFKATSEIHDSVETGGLYDINTNGKQISFALALVQIVLFDMIFSFDSVITAVGLAQDFIIMATAIIIAIIAMLFASTPLSKFIEEHPSIKMLAFSFLFLIGVMLIAEGFSFHIPKGYAYFAIAFSLAVEVLNVMAGKRGRHSKIVKKIIC